MFAGKTIVLCVTGGIAAFKAVMVARILVQAGATVVPVMTTSATKFIGKVTFSGITSESVIDDMWDPRFAGEVHVALAERADAILIVPATADVLSRLAHGRADDLVTALCLCAKSPILAAPAMHPRMWTHPATARNVELLRREGRVTLVGPERGVVASGDVGVGRMSEPEVIVTTLGKIIGQHEDLLNKHIVVTAGPTVEDLDDVRFLGNRSTGKMGFAVAQAALARGARVTLITGPVAIRTPDGATRIDVRSALEMGRALEEVLGLTLRGADALVMAAAVSDYRPAERKSGKLKKTGDNLSLDLIKNPDLLAAVGIRRGTAKFPVLVGFAVESEHLSTYAHQKRSEKKVDFVVGNLAEHGFGGDDDHVLIASDVADRTIHGTKREIADAILDGIVTRLSKP